MPRRKCVQQERQKALSKDASKCRKLTDLFSRKMSLVILMNLWDCFGCLLNTPCLNFDVWSRCEIRKTTLSHWVFLVKLDSSFLIFTAANNLFYFRINIPESTSHGLPKNHGVQQERVHVGESAQHQETNGTQQKSQTTQILWQKRPT